MRCPKCGKEFDLNVLYCETCSVMLEPLEVEDTPAEKKPAMVTVKPERNSPDTVGEKIEDVKIDTLKADIESKFVSTILLEMDQLRKRLTNKEKTFDSLTGDISSSAGAPFGAKLGQGEAEMDTILKKIAKLEAILENLKKKIESDIANLDGQIRSSGKPGPFWFLNEKSRYGKMLFTELETKRILLDIILKKRSPSYFRNKEITRIVIGISIVICSSLIFSWAYFRSSQIQEITPVLHPVAPPSAPMASKPEKQRPAVGEKEVRLLLEDIKNANINKDINLWSSRYSRAYLEGRKEGILEQWNKYDFTSLAYQIDDLNVKGDSVTAVITWDMDLFEKNTGWTKKTHSRLLSDFIVEDGKLKISSVKKL